MPNLIVLILDDPSQTDAVLQAWLGAGVPGVTMLESAGLGYYTYRQGAPDDLPLLPSLASLLRPSEETHRTLLAVVPDDFSVEALVAATEKITRPLDEPDTGILFVLPVSRAWGLHRRRKSPPKRTS